MLGSLISAFAVFCRVSEIGLLRVLYAESHFSIPHSHSAHVVVVVVVVVVVGSSSFLKIEDQ